MVLSPAPALAPAPLPSCSATSLSSFPSSTSFFSTNTVDAESDDLGDGSRGGGCGDDGDGDDPVEAAGTWDKAGPPEGDNVDCGDDGKARLALRARGDGLKCPHLGQRYSAGARQRTDADSDEGASRGRIRSRVCSHWSSLTSPLCEKHRAHISAYCDAADAPALGVSSPNNASASLSYHCFRGAGSAGSGAGVVGWPLGHEASRGWGYARERAWS